MSLCATGIPVSGCAVALRDARVGRARLREALSRVDGDEGVQLAVQRLDARRGRACVSSTLETSLREPQRQLLERGVQHGSGFGPNPAYSITFGNEVEARLDLRRDRLEDARAGRFRSPRPRASAAATSCACDIGLDALGVDRLHLPDQLEDVVELGLDRAQPRRR